MLAEFKKSSVIVAWALLMVGRGFNALKAAQAEAPTAPSTEAKLLTEIRDLLKSR